MDNQKRFYEIMEFFNDDMRIAAFAINEFIDINADVRKIYTQLLNEEYIQHIDTLEEIIDTIEYKFFQQWKQLKTNQLNKSDGIMSIGDNITLQFRAWEL